MKKLVDTHKQTTCMKLYMSQVYQKAFNKMRGFTA